MNENQQKRLRAILNELPESSAGTLLAFAEFLLHRGESNDAAERLPEQHVTPASKAETPMPELLDIPRPEQESVVKAIKRLSETYPMLDRNKLLGETSTLLTQHVVQGRDRVQVIDELEVVFRRYYEDLKKKE